MRSHGMLAVAFALTAVPVLTDAAWAQTSREIITIQLDNADRLAEAQGFRLDGAALSGSSLVGLMEDEGRFFVEVRLEAGVDYLIEGFCDEDCTDIDLTLNGPDGETVTADVELDDVPELRFTAAGTGTHFLGVSMADCSASQCFYAVRVLRK